MKTTVRSLAALVAALMLVAGSAHAHGRGGYGGRGHAGPGYGLLWGTVGFGVGLGVSRAYGPYVLDPYYVYPPATTIVLPQPVYVEGGLPAQERERLAKAPPDPIFYPRNGQSPAQTEADRRECNRWAVTQPNAQTDASVFQRATLACMDAHGYTSR